MSRDAEVRRTSLVRFPLQLRRSAEPRPDVACESGPRATSTSSKAEQTEGCPTTRGGGRDV